MVAESKVRIRGDSRDAERAIDRVKSGLTGLSSTARALPGFTALGAAVAGAFSAQAVSKIADTADALAKLSRRTSVSIEDLSAYAYAAQLSGSNIDEFGSAVDRLNRNISDAASGLATPAEAFSKLGVSVTDAAGNLRRTDDVLGDVMQAFSELPEGPERAAIAMEIFGRSGAKLATFLDLGTEGMAAIREEAERLGIIMDEDLGRAAEQFNDNMLRISKSIEAVQISLGNGLIPALADVTDEFLAAQQAGLSFWEQILLGTSTSFTDEATALADLREQLVELQKAREATLGEDNSFLRSGIFDDVKSLDEQIARVQRFIANYEILDEMRSRNSAEQSEDGKKLAALEKKLGAARLDLARAVARETKKGFDEQIKDAEKLKTALEKAWQASVDGARAASQEAAGLLKQAAQSQADFQRQANARREQDLSPEQQQRAIVDRAQQAADEANYRAAAAEVEAIDGRAQNARDYAEQAKKLIEEAADAANQVEDNETAAQLLERLGEASAAAIRTEARLKQAEAQSLDDTAKAQQAQINTLVDQLAKLKAESGDVPVVVDTDSAKARVEELQKAIAELKAAAASVPIGAGASGDFSNTGRASGSFSSGGFTGWGGKYQPAGVVHHRESVNRSEVVAQRGALPFLTRFNQVGMQALAEWYKKAGFRGYASGGLVSGVRVPSVRAQSAPAMRPVTLDLGAYGRYDMQAGDGQIEGMERALRRERLKRGGR